MSWTTSENAASSFAGRRLCELDLDGKVSYSVLHHNQVQPPVTGNDLPTVGILSWVKPGIEANQTGSNKTNLALINRLMDPRAVRSKKPSRFPGQ